MGESVLLIDKNLAIAVNRSKWIAVAEHVKGGVYGVFPENWIENGIRFQGRAEMLGNLKLMPVPVWWTGTENRTLYKPNLFTLRLTAAPGVIICFEEPFSLYALQALFLKFFRFRQAKLVFHSWYNFPERKIRSYRPGWVYSAIEWLTTRNASLIFGANKEAVRRYRRFGAVAEYLPFGLDLEAFKAAARTTKTEFRIGFAGRMEHFKGIDLLLEAFHQCRCSPFTSLEFIGSGSMTGALEIKAKELGIENNVAFTSGVAPEQMPAVISNLTVLVLPSRTTYTWAEQLGRVLVEAMACGVAVIGSSSGSIPDVIGEAGLVFTEGDAADLARKIDALYFDHDLRTRCIMKGLAQAEQYSSTSFATRVSEVLHHLIERSHA